MWETIHKWHRSIGIIAAVFVIFLVVSGIMLNHTELLNLDKRFVQNGIFLDMYDINPSREPRGFLSGGRWVTQVGDRVYLDRQEIAEKVKQLIGIVSTGKYLVVAFDGQLLLLNGYGSVIEHLSGSQGVPAGMRRIGITGSGDVIIRGTHGDYGVDLERLDWQEEDFIEAEWSSEITPPADLLVHLLQLYRGKGLTLERVLLDLHSGRIIGGWGVYIVDAAALLFFLLALSGAWMWFKRGF
jgi:hypothetical protein